MATRQQNELLCRVGPETAMGNVFRRFWHPVCTSAQLPKPDCNPLRVRLLGEDYVAFRDTNGAVGLLEELCMHRGASLALGRVEDCGIRCLFHGWKFGVDGTIQEMPNYPDKTYMARHRAKAFPVREAGDMVFAYVGPAELEPEFPHFPFIDVPEENRTVIRVNTNCNYLQNLEGGLDSSHSSMLHSDYLRKDWRQNAVSTAMDDAAPALEAEDTDFGYHYSAIRHVETRAGERIDNVRIMPFIMPSSRIIPGRRNISIGGPVGGHADMFIFEVPADDENTSTYIVIYGTKPVDRTAALKRLGLDNPKFWSETDPNYRLTAEEGFGQDRTIMHESWTGFNGGVYIEDLAVIGSMGKIYDRTKEHLVPADRAVMRARQKLIEAAADVGSGKEPLGLHVDYSKLAAFDGDVPIKKHWRELVPGHVVISPTA
jgi:phthalate 4,5-dioxygenase oxygenase subunit